MKKKNSVSVDQAIFKGQLLLVYLPLLIIIFTMFISHFLIDYYSQSGWLYALAIFLAIFLAWLQWSFCVAKWKIWAYKNVRNVHELYRKAIEFKMIWPDGSFFNKTEIISRQDKTELHYLERKFEDEDEYFDDKSVPNEVEIFYSKITLGLFLVLGILSIIVAVFVMERPQAYLFYPISILFFYEFYKKYKIRQYLMIDLEGINYKGKVFLWDKISDEKVVNDFDKKMHKLEFFYSEELNAEDLYFEEGEEIELDEIFNYIEIELNDLSIKPSKIEKIIQVFRVRYENSISQ